MTLTKKQLGFGYATLIFLGLYSPLLEILRKNTNIQELYGFSEVDFLITFIFGFVLPWILSLGIAIKFPSKMKFVTVFWLFFSTLFFIAPMFWGTKILILVLLSLFSLSTLKNPHGFLKILVWASLIVLPDGCYKTFFLMKDHLSLRLNSPKLPQFKKASSAPKNVFLFLLDGTDLTTSYLDEQELPRADLLPTLHQVFKSDFIWFPRAVTNGPQTYLAVPVMMSGVFDYSDAKSRISDSWEIFSAAAQSYNVTGFFYLNFYRNFCVQNRKHCHPFGQKQQSESTRGASILFQMYAHRWSGGFVQLPFKLGKDFKPEGESYKFDELLSKVKEQRDGNNFYYFHLFRRTLHGLIDFDQNLARLITLLKEEKLYEDSMIMITADHGYDETQTGNKYGEQSKFTPRVFRIPVAIKPVGINQGKTSAYPAQTIDIFSTFLVNAYDEKAAKEIKLDGVDLLVPQIDSRRHLVHCTKESTAEFLTPHQLTECKK